MGWLSWFGKEAKNDDFEDVLNQLEASIRETEEKLAFIIQREKRSVVFVTTWSIAAWAIYIALWWFDIFGSTQQQNDQVDELQAILQSVGKAAPIAAIPILIYYTRRIVKAFYSRKAKYEGKELQALRKKQKDQIDKLKKLSNYDKITEMLMRHGQISSPARNPGMMGTPNNKNKTGSAFSTPVSANNMQNVTPAKGSALNGQQRQILQQQQQQFGGKGPLPGTPQRPNQPNLPGLQQLPGLSLSAVPSQPSQPKGFFDRMADAAATALLGDNEQHPASKYALICQKCFAHNGLALKEEIMDIQFICPKCGSFNPSRRARMTGTSGPPSASFESGNTSLDSLPSPTERSSQFLAGKGDGTGSKTASPTTDVDPSQISDEGEYVGNQRVAETSKVKPKQGRENLRERGKGKTANEETMEVDDE